MIEQLEDAFSTRYSIIREHCGDTGLIQLPVYGQNQPCKIVRHHAPTETLKIHWLAEKDGGQPYLPHPSLFDSNNVFLKWERNGEAPTLLPSLEAHTWKLWGTYYYAVVNPIGPTSNFNTGLIAPDTITDIKDTTIPGSNWQKGILDSDETAAYAQPGAADLTVINPVDQPLPQLHDPITGE